MYMNVKFMKTGNTSDDHMVVRLEDTLTKTKKEIHTDLVVLSAALEASEGTIEAAKVLGIPLTEGQMEE